MLFLKGLDYEPLVFGFWIFFEVGALPNGFSNSSNTASVLSHPMAHAAFPNFQLRVNGTRGLLSTTTAYLFADEAGDFTFKTKKGASRYFVICSICTTDCSLSGPLLAIRRRLAASGEPDRDKLHATSDRQELRDEVFALLADANFRVDATLLEKSKAQPHVRASNPTFYKYAWYYHFKYIGPHLVQSADNLLITASALGEKKTRAAFKEGINNTLQQTIPRNQWEVAFMDSSKDPCLWAADYCAWAIQRKWELNDTRSHKLIADKIKTEFDLWEFGKHHHYE